MARREREFNGKVFSDDGSGRLYNKELKKYLIYRPYPLLVDEVNESDKVEPDNKQEYTSKQLKDKFGTDDTSLINAGKEEEDKVAKVEDKDLKNISSKEAIDIVKRQHAKENIMKNFPYINEEQAEKFVSDLERTSQEIINKQKQEETIQPDKVWNDNIPEKISDKKITISDKQLHTTIDDNNIMEPSEFLKTSDAKDYDYENYVFGLYEMGEISPTQRDMLLEEWKKYQKKHSAKEVIRPDIEYED